MNEPTEHKPGKVLSLLQNKCPRCRRGNLFKTSNAYHLRSFMKMHDNCPVCGQPVELEVGFYYGTSYVSYMISIFISVFTFVLWWLLIGFSFKDDRLFWWIGFNAFLLIVMQPLLMRLSRTMWLWFFVRYRKNWQNEFVGKPERQNDDLKNAW